MSDHSKANDNYINGIFEFMKDNFAKSIQLLTRAIELDTNHKLAYMSRGSAFLRLDRLDEAIADFDRAIQINPNSPRAYHLRGLAKEKQGIDAAAIADFDKAIEMDPEYAAAYYSRATLHTKMGNEDLAVDDIQMVQHLTNTNIETFANENNVWRSQHLRIEAMAENEIKV
ncbi:MAG: tetratricopeptide repeat protein [Desulfobacterales bacterium]|jgi:tetratricopeptide (TPR) repeat protein